MDLYMQTGQETRRIVEWVPVTSQDQVEIDWMTIFKFSSPYYDVSLER